jgi:site-specific recombinase XerC
MSCIRSVQRAFSFIARSYPYTLLRDSTGNIAAVQKQLGHRQAAYAMQYAQTTTEELAQVLDDR